MRMEKVLTMEIVPSSSEPPHLVQTPMAIQAPNENGLEMSSM